tara:strand:- start:1032 stop:1877 length:846 start_codon:yes stop_codon:yes gene_type:complete
LLQIEEMRLIKTVKELKTILAAATGSVGLVPTMGAIHQGHVALLTKARSDCGTVVASIFVNPHQFNIKNDYLNYPKNLSTDLEIMENSGVDIVFKPNIEEIYPNSFTTTVNVKSLSDRLEGAFRPGHLDSVATIVIKLLNICQPNFVYFGQKDIQQLLMIKRMIIDLNIQTNLVSIDTVRDKDGLALSSRNNHLTEAQKQSALGLYSSLKSASNLSRNGEKSANKIKSEMEQILLSHNLDIDYLAICDSETLDEVTYINGAALAVIAAYCGNIRLIDNMLI